MTPPRRRTDSPSWSRAWPQSLVCRTPCPGPEGTPPSTRQGRGRRPPCRSYPPGQSDNVHHSYGPHIPFKDPGGSGNAWDGAQGSQGITAPVSDEESDVDSSTFMRNDILKKIDILTKDAESFEDVKTILALSELKRFVETL